MNLFFFFILFTREQNNIYVQASNLKRINSKIKAKQENPIPDPNIARASKYVFA